MEEIMMERQMLEKLQIHDTDSMMIPTEQNALLPAQQNRRQRQRTSKKSSAKTEANLEAELNSLKNEIEYMPMKTPISILQELLSRRGK